MRVEPNVFYRGLYVAADGDGLHKIGMSSAPEARCRDLTKARQKPVSLIWQSPLTRFASHVERASHQSLQKHAVGREWFDVTAAQAIEAVERELKRRER